MKKSRVFKKQEEQYESPLKAGHEKGWTRIRNYGKGSSTLKIEYGKRAGERLFRAQMIRIKGKDSNGKEFELIVNATNLQEVLRYA